MITSLGQHITFKVNIKTYDDYKHVLGLMAAAATDFEFMQKYQGDICREDLTEEQWENTVVNQMGDKGTWFMARDGVVTTSTENDCNLEYRMPYIDMVKGMMAPTKVVPFKRVESAERIMGHRICRYKGDGGNDLEAMIEVNHIALTDEGDVVVNGIDAGELVVHWEEFDKDIFPKLGDYMFAVDPETA